MQTAGPLLSAAKAGFWIRFLAYLLDTLVVGIPALILLYLVGSVSSSGGQGSGPGVAVEALLIVGSIAYFLYFWTRPTGQTLGMKAVNIRVVKTDGSPITVGTAVVRYLGMIINSIIFGLPIGWIWAAFDANKQGWHDKMAGTYVVKTS
jgi:uncharacterized RDD family membrane protein YckC